jgi:hypothetical protein
MVNCRFIPLSRQTKDYIFGIAASLLSIPCIRRVTIDWLGVKIMCQSRVTCFSELV